MLETVAFVAAHFVLTVLYFLVVQKPLFIIYNRTTTETEYTSADIRKVFLKGVKTDRITAGYLTGVSLLVLMVLSLIPGAGVYECMLVCMAVLSVIVSLAVVSDTGLYRFWQFKLEASVLTYLRHPKEAFASVTAAYLLCAFIALVLMACVFFGFMWLSLQPLKGCERLCPDGFGWHLLYILLALVIEALLFANIRGLNSRPYNPSVAYFSVNQFLNHSALNPVYNFIFSLSIKDEYRRGFRLFPHDECAKDFSGLYPTKGTPQRELLRTKRPNILLIIWESLSARYFEPLGGTPGVLPNLERLSREGVLFTQCYAGSFRTERGLVCVLNGIPGQPTDTLARHSRKLPNVPALPRSLRAAGYDTTALHGGNCRIMYKAELYLAAGHNRLIEQKDLPDLGPKNRWGYHDGGVFDWLYDDIQARDKAGKPWFTTLQTLSSHEPFRVPYRRLSDDMANSFAYTDDCLGRFIDRLKATPGWDNLLVVVTGDHGFAEGIPMVRSTFPHIPVMMFGGAVKEPATVDMITAQTDIAATLLGQLGLPHDDFKFSRDVLADTYTYPFALHTYNNGFLFVDGTGFTDYDNVAAQAVENPDEAREHKGKVILQTLYEYLSSK